jgi:hypothetical protein
LAAWIDPMLTMLPFRLAASAWRHQARPLIVGELEERHDCLDPCVVHQDVERPELLPRLVDHRLDFRALRHVGLHHDGAPALLPDPFRNRLGFFHVRHVVDRDISPFVGEHLRDAPPDPAACSRHQCDLAL